MPFDRPLSIPPPAIIQAAVDGALEQGAADLAVALAEGSPRDTGELAQSWYADGRTVTTDVPYAQYVDVDTRGAERVLVETQQLIDDRVIAALGA
jgi:hypothetical protein